MPPEEQQPAANSPVKAPRDLQPKQPAPVVINAKAEELLPTMPPLKPSVSTPLLERVELVVETPKKPSMGGRIKRWLQQSSDIHEKTKVPRRIKEEPAMQPKTPGKKVGAVMGKTLEAVGSVRGAVDGSKAFVNAHLERGREDAFEFITGGNNVVTDYLAKNPPAPNTDQLGIERIANAALGFVNFPVRVELTGNNVVQAPGSLPVQQTPTKPVEPSAAKKPDSPAR